MSEEFNISHELKDLLSSEECVVFPGFGAFVVKYIPAQITPEQITAPKNSVYFNSRLTQDDGVLIHWVKQQINKDYAASKLFVADIIYQWKKDLSLGKTVVFENLGKIYLDNEGNYCFEEKAVLEDDVFFGLEDIYIRPVEAKRDKIVPINPVKEIKALEKTPEGRFPWRSAAAIVLPILGFGLGLFSSMMYDPQTGFSTANLFPVVSTTEKQEEIQPKESIGETDFFTPEEWKEIAEHQHNQLKAKSAIVTSPEVTPKIESKEITPVKRVASKPFHIIAGCFSSKENADQLVYTLQAKGFEANIVGTTPNGLFRVAYSSFSNRKDALKALANIKLKENRSAWLFKN